MLCLVVTSKVSDSRFKCICGPAKRHRVKLATTTVLDSLTIVEYNVKFVAAAKQYKKSINLILNTHLTYGKINYLEQYYS